MHLTVIGVLMKKKEKKKEKEKEKKKDNQYKLKKAMAIVIGLTTRISTGNIPVAPDLLARCVCVISEGDHYSGVALTI